MYRSFKNNNTGCNFIIFSKYCILLNNSAFWGFLSGFQCIKFPALITLLYYIRIECDNYFCMHIIPIRYLFNFKLSFDFFCFVFLRKQYFFYRKNNNNNCKTSRRYVNNNITGCVY